MTRSMQVITGSMIVAIGISLAWFNAPVLPSLAGAAVGGLALYWRARRVTA